MALKIMCEMWHVFGVCVFVYTHCCFFLLLFQFSSLSFITHSLMMTVSRFHICYEILVSWTSMFFFISLFTFRHHHHQHHRHWKTNSNNKQTKYQKICQIISFFSILFFFVFVFDTIFLFKKSKCVLPTIKSAFRRFISLLTLYI